MFWGLIMEPQRRYTQVVKKSFHISMAALDASTSNNEPSQVVCGYDGRNYLLCTLQKDKAGMMQCALDLNFEVGTEVSFATNGTSHVHLTGYLTDDLLDNDAEEEEDDEEVEEEQLEIEEAQEKPKNKKKKLALENAQNGPASKKAKRDEIVSSTKGDLDDEDEDSDDSDVDFDALMGEEDDEEGEEEEDDEDGEEEEDAEEDSDDEDEESEDEEEEETKPAPKMNGIAKEPKKKQKEKENKKTKEQASPKGKQEQATPKQDKNKQQQNQKGSAKKKTLANGVVVEDLREGNGPVAQNGKFVHVYYEGKLKSNGKVFDATQKGSGFGFRLGKGEVIKGWDIGVSGMKVGGKRRVTCPPQMAYGAKGSPPVIPPNSTLVFEVELKKVS